MCFLRFMYVLSVLDEKMGVLVLFFNFFYFFIKLLKELRIIFEFGVDSFFFFFDIVRLFEYYF